MFANLLLRFVGKVFGSKLIIGVAVAAVAAVGVLGWLNIHNLKAAAQANQQVEQIKEALAETEAELETAIAERDKLNAALKRKHDREKIARARARKAEVALKELEASDEKDADWANARVPDDIVGWLRGDERPSD